MNRLPADSLLKRPSGCGDCIHRLDCKKDPKKCTASGQYLRIKTLAERVKDLHKTRPTVAKSSEHAKKEIK